MKYFPDVADYDLSTAGGMALYGAHCDLDPVLGMIEEIDRSVEETIKKYGDLGIKAQDFGDFRTSCELLDLQAVFSAQVRPIVYESMLLIMVSRLEESFSGWCRVLHAKDKGLPAFEEHHKEKGALENAISYIKEYGHINGIKQDKDWEFISVIRDARNMIVHNGSRVKEPLWDKMDSFKIGMYPEDHRVYLDSETIHRMYDAIIRFINRVFLIQPESQGEKA